MDNAAKNSILEPPITSSLIDEGNKKNKFGLFLAIIVVAVIAILLGYYSTKHTKNPIISTNVAIEVNGQQISKEFFNHRIDIQTNFYKVVSPDSGKLATVEKDEAESIIKAVLLEQELSKRGLMPSDAEIKKAVGDAKNRYEEVAASKSGVLSYDQAIFQKYKMNLDDRYYVEKKELMMSKINNLKSQKRFWGVWLKRFGPSDGPEQATSAQKAQDKKQLELAEQILAKVKAGENLQALAQKYSEDPISKPKGGDIGFLNVDASAEGQFPQSQFASMAVVSQASQKLSVGEADIFEYPFGYAVIKVTEIKGDWPYKDYDDFIEQSKKSANIKVNVSLN